MRVMTLVEAAETLFGSGGETLTLGQMSARGLLVYVVVLVIVRLGKKRFMSGATAFDIIIGIMLGSVASRAITGNAPLVPALGAAATIIAAHWVFSWAALRSHRFGTLVKGHDRLLVRDGKVDEAAMRKTHMTERDLMEELRENGVDDLAEVAEARLERDGALSVIKAKGSPKVVEVRVEEGVQLVRVEIGGSG
jgi:uncharacterized membrane protein YcaP (DUF421 family)